MNWLRFHKFIKGKEKDMNHNLQRVRIPAKKNSTGMIVFLVFLLIAYLITTVGLFVLAFLLYKFSLTETAVNIGIILIYIFAS